MESFSAHVWKQVQSCKNYLDEQEEERQRAIEYYQGKMRDLPHEEQTSSVVSMDLRETVKKVLPSVMRAILGNDKIVEYEATGPEDEAGADQATDFINRVIVPECDAEKAIYDAIHDAMIVKTGILKWSAYEKRHVEIEEFTDQPDEAMFGIEGDPSIEIVDHTKEPETDPDVLALYPNAMRHSFKVRKVTVETRPCLEAIPRGVFLITPNAESIEEAELVGEEIVTTRSALVEMGYERDKVWQLSTHHTRVDDGDTEELMGEDYSSEYKDTVKALEEVRIYEVYIKVDEDGDGIAEIHRVVFGDEQEGSDGEMPGQRHITLGKEIVSEAPYAEIVIERDPHQFEGHSFYEDAREPQRVKTALMRETLNNLYQQNDPRAAIDVDAVQNVDDITNRRKPIVLKSGRSVNDAVQWQITPFVGQHSLQMMQYWDEVLEERTGVTDASGGLDPEQFQNTSATAAQMMGERGAAQAEFIIRSIAGPMGGLRKAFKGLLKLVIAHADRPRTVKLKGKWVQYDPRTWNANMNVTINVGLGAGTKERDMAILQIIKQLQSEIIAVGGFDNGIVRPDHVYNMLAKITETAGLPSPDPFFAKPDMKAITAKMAQQQVSPEQQKIQAQMQIEQMKVQTAREKERAQMEADLVTKQADIDAREREFAQDLEFQRAKLASEERIALAKIEADLVKHRETLDQQRVNAPIPNLVEGGIN